MVFNRLSWIKIFNIVLDIMEWKLMNEKDYSERWLIKRVIKRSIFLGKL